MTREEFVSRLLLLGLGRNIQNYYRTFPLELTSGAWVTAYLNPGNSVDLVCTDANGAIDRAATLEDATFDAAFERAVELMDRQKA